MEDRRGIEASAGKPQGPPADEPLVTRSRVPLSPATLLLPCLAACLQVPPAPESVRSADAGPPDASSPPRVLEWEIRDRVGRVRPADSAPRRPLLRLHTSRPVWGFPEPTLLLSGTPDTELLADLARPPLRSDTERRLLSASVERESTAGWTTLAPLETLAPGALATFALAGWAADETGRAVEAVFAVHLQVATGSDGGAIVTDAWPADGTAGVPPNLAFAALRFDGVVRVPEGSARLETNAGAAVPCIVVRTSCESIGWSGGHCLRLAPRRPLSAGALHRIVVDEHAVDATGAPVGPWAAELHTASAGDDQPPRLLDEACALDEQAIGGVCALVTDASVTLRLRAAEPARVFLDSAFGGDAIVAPRGEATLALSRLPPDATVPATLRMVDQAGNEVREEISLRTWPGLAALSVTEVRADPLGPEPRQEYVEVLNSAPVPLDLQGFAISDRPDRQGDVVLRSQLVPAGARALLVPDGFDPLDPRDPPVPPGAVIIRVGTSLASGGLSNSGEPVFLRDPEGRRVSAAPATPPPRPGACIVRVVRDIRSGAPGSFDYDAVGGCTPASPDRVP